MLPSSGRDLTRSLPRLELFRLSATHRPISTFPNISWEGLLQERELQMNQTMQFALAKKTVTHSGGFALASLRTAPPRGMSAVQHALLRLITCAAFFASLVLLLGFLPVASLGQSSQSYTWNNAVTSGGGGFIPGIVFNPSQKNLMYVRTDIGGAYRWDPVNLRWMPLMDWVGFDDWNTLGVESIATDPVDPTRFYVAAGTYTNSFTTSNGAILRSTDQGNTFQRTNLPFKLGGNMPGRSMGERLQIDPNLDSILLFGARSGNGLWKSTDFGATWSQVTSFTAQGNYVQTAGDIYLGDPDGVVWEVFDPRTGTPGKATQTIYVGIANLTTSIYRSTDGGNTWAAVPGQPTGFLPHHAVLSSDGFLYVTFNNNAGPYDGTSGDVWKLNTATGAWTLISPVPSTDKTNDYFGYGGLAVDAQHPQTIMVTALNSWWPDTMLWRSTNGGTSWTRIWDFTSYPNRSFRYTQDISLAPWLNFGVTNPVPPVPSPKLGWMVGTMAIDPFNSDHMLYGTGATLYGSNNLTQWDAGNPITISVAAQGIEEAAVTGLVSPPTGTAHLYSTLGDISGFVHNSLTTSPPVMYSIPFAGSYTSIDYAELSPSFLVIVGNGNPTANPPVRSSGFTFSAGSSWFQGNNDPAGLGANGGGTVAAAADASRVLWAPTGLGAFFSTDNGNTWTASTGLPAGGSVASDRVNPKKFYAFANGTFYLSTDGGATFTATAATGLPKSGDPVRFRAVAGTEGDVWLAGGSNASGVYGLWHSTNSGASFTKLANVDKADTIGFGMPAPGQTYPTLFSSAQVGGVRGIFRSDNMGAAWIQINDAQHQWGSTNAAITGDPRIYGRVYLSTNGRGIIYGDISGSIPPGFSLSSSPASVNLTTGSSASSTITMTPTGGFSGTVTYSASGLPSGVTAAFTAGSAANTETVTLTATGTAATGNSTVTITGTSGTLSSTTTVSLTVSVPQTPKFTLSASPANVLVNLGSSASSTITVTPSGGFSGAITYAASGLPSGVTAAFAAGSAANTETVTLTASTAATVGSATVTITGTSGSLSATATIGLTVATPPPPGFALAASPASVTVNTGATATSTITVTPSGGFTGSVALTASGLPSGVTAAFSPTSTTGTSTLTFTASSSATAASATVTVTGTSGSVTHTATIALTVSAVTGTGGVTVTPVINSNSAFFNDEGVKISNTGTITSLTVTITVQATTGVTFSGQYNTVGGQITMSHSSTASAITYQYTLGSGQTLGAGSGWLFDAQAGGNGSVHPVAGDTYTVTYTTGGSTFTQTGQL